MLTNNVCTHTHTHAHTAALLQRNCWNWNQSVLHRLDCFIVITSPPPQFSFTCVSGQLQPIKLILSPTKHLTNSALLCGCFSVKVFFKKHFGPAMGTSCPSHVCMCIKISLPVQFCVCGETLKLDTACKCQMTE